MTTDYSKWKIKSYDLWDLYLHTEQYPYVGRAYAAAKREDAVSVSDMRREETREFFEKVLFEWEKAMKTLFSPDRTNVACLANTWEHLHWHMIPRYKTPRTVYDAEFIDPRPTGNYAPYEKRKLPEDVLETIRDDVKKVL